MALENFTLKSETFDEAEYQAFLVRLIDFDREVAFKVIPKLALRSAMRIVPLIAVKGDLSFWSQENRVKYLAAVLQIFEPNQHLLDIRFDIAAAASEAASLDRYANAAATISATVSVAAAAAALASFAIQSSHSAGINPSVFYADYIHAHASAMSGAAAFGYELLKKDIEELSNDSFKFEFASLWWGHVPTFFIENLSKLEVIVAQLPRTGGDQEAFNIINSALDRLWGVPRVNIIIA